MTADVSSTVGGGELLRHQAFVRRLARELVGVGRADDLVQDAWVAALERPPRVAAAARGWFRVVLRNLAGRRARDELRRTAREERVARAEGAHAPDDPAEVVERLALERRLVRAVEALDEPYRSTVFLRYFEDLSPRAIADRQGAPLATVKTRLRRALVQLRAGMDADGEGRAWMTMLARIAAPGGALATKGALAAGAVVLVASTLVWLRVAGDGRGPASGATRAAPVSVARDAEEPERSELVAAEAPTEEVRDSVAVTPAPGERVEEPAAAEPREAPPPEEERDVVFLHGRVLFPDGTGAAGAAVALGPWETVADASGVFALPVARESTREDHTSRHETLRDDSAVVAWLAGWAPAIGERAGRTLQEAVREGREPTPVRLVLPGPSLAITGVVLDHTGSPAYGWRISLLDGTPVFSGRFRPLSAEDVVSGAEGHVELEEGRFRFEGLAPGRSYRIRAWNQRTLDQVTSEPLLAGTHDVVLRASGEPWRAVVDGVVVGLDGLPIEDVRCRLSMAEYRSSGGTWNTTGQEVRTGPDGRFEFVDVPRSELYIRFNGGGSGTSYDLAPGDPGRGLRIEIVRSGGFELELLPGGETPDGLVFLDEAGERLRIEVDLGPGSTSGTSRLALHEGGRAAGRVSELAREVALLRGSRELYRAPVVIRHGETKRLRL